MTLNKIDKNTPLGEILKIKSAKEILLKYRVPCLSCPMFSLERNITLGEVCALYNLDEKKIISQLQDLLKGRKNKKNKKNG